MKCPNCGVECPPLAQSCNCSYDFGHCEVQELPSPLQSDPPVGRLEPTADAVKAQPPMYRRLFFLGISAALATVTALSVDCALPAIVASVHPRYRFDVQAYWEVFVAYHHDIPRWFGYEPPWMGVTLAIGVIFGPIVGGMILHFFRLRLGRPGAPKRHDILKTAIIFAACYFIAGTFASAIAQASNPYPFDWSEFFQLGKEQFGTLFFLAAAMGAVGASVVERFGPIPRPHSTPSETH